MSSQNKGVISDIAKELGLTKEEVESVIYSVFYQMREVLYNVPIRDERFKPSDFDKMRTLCRIPYVGSLYIRGLKVWEIRRQVCIKEKYCKKEDDKAKEN